MKKLLSLLLCLGIILTCAYPAFAASTSKVTIEKTETFTSYQAAILATGSKGSKTDATYDANSVNSWSTSSVTSLGTVYSAEGALLRDLRTLMSLDLSNISAKKVKSIKFNFTYNYWSAGAKLYINKYTGNAWDTTTATYNGIIGTKTEDEYISSENAHELARADYTEGSYSNGGTNKYSNVDITDLYDPSSKKLDIMLKAIPGSSDMNNVNQYHEGGYLKIYAGKDTTIAPYFTIEYELDEDTFTTTKTIENPAYSDAVLRWGQYYKNANTLDTYNSDEAAKTLREYTTSLGTVYDANGTMIRDVKLLTKLDLSSYDIKEIKSIKFNFVANHWRDYAGAILYVNAYTGNAWSTDTATYNNTIKDKTVTDTVSYPTISVSKPSDFANNKLMSIDVTQFYDENNKCVDLIWHAATTKTELWTSYASGPIGIAGSTNSGVYPYFTVEYEGEYDGALLPTEYTGEVGTDEEKITAIFALYDEAGNLVKTQPYIDVEPVDGKVSVTIDLAEEETLEGYKLKMFTLDSITTIMPLCAAIQKGVNN